MISKYAGAILLKILLSTRAYDPSSDKFMPLIAGPNKAVAFSSEAKGL